MSRELERAYLPDRFHHPSPPTPKLVHRDIAVLIVAYRNPKMLRDCLDAAIRHLPAAPILVWDNSGPGYPGLDAVVSDYASVKWFLGSPNIGFAAAVNVLAQQLPEHDILLLNPDAVLQGPLTDTLTAIQKPSVAAAAPLTLDDNADPGTYRPWDVAHRKQSLGRALVSWAGYAPQMRGSRWSELYQSRPTIVGGYLTGACLAISRDAWNAVGCFDEEFFLYGEEADWQRRARSVEWTIELVDEPGIVHTGHGTVADDPIAAQRSQDLLRANIALNLELDKGSRQANLYLAGTTLLDHVQRSARRERASRRRLRTGRPSVIITTNRLVFGGAERHHALLAAELSKRGYDMTIACMQRFGPLVAEIDPSVRVVRQPWWAPSVDLSTGESIIIGGDTNTETGFATLWRAAGSGRRWLVAPHIPPNPDGPTYSRGLAAAMRRSDGVIALSPAHWAEATAYQDLGTRSFIAPNGVASAADVAGAPARPETASPPHLVMLSRIVEHKNPHLLIQALDGLRELPWRLSIFGDGPDRERLEAMTPADLADRITWRGWSPGPEPALADCDLLCVPSRSEAFPLVILEAMARRIPVAASAVCAVRDMIDGGRAGILVDDVSVAGWRAALDDALRHTDTWRELGERGFERMRNLYTIEAMADAYETAIAAVL